jgi:L-ascorbate metabolism protein UlaG (beta-lactamase superfamily)
MQNSMLSRRSFLTGTASAALAGLSASSWSEPQDLGRPDTLRVQKLAWAGVRLQLGDSTLFIDPLINHDVWESALADPMVPVDVERGDRFVLVTHRHPDHFDPLAVRKIVGDSGLLVCDSDVAPLAAGQGFKVRRAAMYEPVLLGDFTATAVPAMDGYGDPQISWVVSAGGRRILHCGDTLWHGYWWRIGRQFGPLDAAFLPINGARFEWRKPWSDIPAVMTPEQAVAAAVVTGAELIVPIHYGVAGAEGYREIPNCEQKLLEAAKARGVPVQVLRAGEWLSWPNPKDGHSA